MDLHEAMDIVKACRRSRVKLRVYDALEAFEVAPVAEIADRACTTVERVRAVMVGDGGDYRSDTSLVALRVAELRETGEGTICVLTLRGRSAHAMVRARLLR